MEDGMCWECSPLKDVPKDKRKSTSRQQDPGVDLKARASGEYAGGKNAEPA